MSGPRPAVDRTALSEVLAEFAATLLADYAVRDIVAHLVAATTRVLAVDGAGVMVTGDPLPGAPPDGGLLRMALATQGTVEDLEARQDAEQSGPCMDCHRSGAVVTSHDLAVAGDWPGYQRQATAQGLHAVLAVPMRARGRGWGVLDVYRCAPGPFTDDEVAVARTLADVATSYLVVAADRDSARRAQEELAWRAMHDPLTGLVVRWVLMERLERALAGLDRRTAVVGTLFLDLDGLKAVNDTHGHSAGDELLRRAAASIAGALRPTDVLARVGGDEFVVLLESMSTPEEAAVVAERILSLLRSTGDAAPGPRPSASIGIAVTSDPSTAPEALLARADAAMYAAKRAGRGRIAVAGDELPVPGATTAADPAPASPTRRVELALELERALDRAELVLHYQPIVDLTSGDVYGVEALARWEHPSRGLLPASAFVHVARNNHLVHRLDSWALGAACRQLTRWDEELGAAAPRRVFVNLCVASLRDRSLPGEVAAALAECGLAAERLVLEITELGTLTELGTGHVVRALAELGCGLAIDDFGSGNASLNRVLEVPVPILKVDQSFAAALGATHAGRAAAATAALSAALTLGRLVGRPVIVEGVEDERTADALRELGFRYAQGVHFGAPLPA
ncbi:EAL domain-containing protein [Kineococcus sp. R8]|uniref:EAL domain-containing protein n=1 Tax=Kineococcus siccus TaxID=2696567 RepID=UPI001412C8BA|nr:EAL domain-containing protein [Kineococcus siccus]